MGITLNEYLFIDRRRVDSYFEQVRSQKHVDKYPVWSASAGLTGVSVQGSETVSERDYSYHEKLKVLVKKLRPHQGEIEAIGEGSNEEGDFALEAVIGTRCVLSPEAIGLSESPSIAVWSCRRHPTSKVAHRPQGFRYLIEDFQETDRARARTSGFSALEVLLRYLTDHLGSARVSNCYDVPADTLEFAIDRDLAARINDRQLKGWYTWALSAAPNSRRDV